MRVKIYLLIVTIILVGCQSNLFKAEAVDYGIAQQYPGDVGIKAHSAVIFASGIETSNWYRQDFNYTSWMSDNGYRVANPQLAFYGGSVLEYQNIKGMHFPYLMDVSFVGIPQDVVFLRWYRRYEPGYDFSCESKGNGVYALAPGLQSSKIPAGKPTGYDRYSAKLTVWTNGDGTFDPRIYTYNPEQADLYGDNLQQNIGTPIKLKAGQWYSFEIMLKANDAGQRNGEVKLWIDGTLKTHYTNMHFRDTNELKINELNITAYMGGNCTATKNQKIWDDNIVLATQYIGPMGISQSGNPNDIIIDNNDTGFSTIYAQDAWQEYTKVGGQHYGNSHLYNYAVGTGQDIATWSFTVPKPGNYEVYAWWWAADYRPTDVPYTINYYGTNTTVRVNQRTNGGQWNSLGTYSFQDKGSVILSDDISSGYGIVADAIRLVYRSDIPTSTPTGTPLPSSTNTPTPTSTPTPTQTSTPIPTPVPTIHLNCGCDCTIGINCNCNCVW